MQAGWYLKSADAPVAHWWDGLQYTANTTPLSGYPFPVHADPLAVAAVATPPVSAPPVAAPPATTPPVSTSPYAAAAGAAPYGSAPAGAPAYGAPAAYGAAQPGYTPPSGPPKTGMNKGLLWGLIGGALLLLIIIGVVVAVVVGGLTRPDGGPIAEPDTGDQTTSSPSTAPDEPTDDSTGASGNRGNDATTEGLFVGFVRDGVPSLAGETDESVLAAGYLVCEMFDEGQDFFSISDVIVQSGVAADESIIFVAYSVGALCPEHTESIG